MVTTKIATILDEPIEYLTGEEVWPIIGDAVTPDQARSVIQKLKGFPKYWACDLKAVMTCLILKFPLSWIAAGSTFVFSSDMRSSYGYFYNPPLEFHIWIELPENQIVDFALPGIIEKGLKSRDRRGVLIEGREPGILAGKPPEWIRYKKYGRYI